MQTTRFPAPAYPLERFFAILAAAACVAITAFLWWQIGAYQAMWPLPALYFIEVAALGVLGAIPFFRTDPRLKFISWGAAGALGEFSILGAFSVGFFYLPVALILFVISLTLDLRNKGPILAHLGIFALGAILQAAVMLAVIRFLFP